MKLNFHSIKDQSSEFDTAKVIFATESTRAILQLRPQLPSQLSYQAVQRFRNCLFQNDDCYRFITSRVRQYGDSDERLLQQSRLLGRMKARFLNRASIVWYQF